MRELEMRNGEVVDADRETCAECGEPPVGVTMGPEMDGWSCPYCGHYNTVDS